ncbi:MAG: VCBS repeat-containing protein, partial [Nannocystis sp.]
MRRLHYLPLSAFLLSVLLPLVGQGAPWLESKQFFAEGKNLGSSMVDAADLDNDGYVDLVFANGSGYDKGTPDSHKSQQAYHNDAGVSTTDISDQVFGNGFSANGRAIKLRDVDGDDDIDIVLGTTWQSQSQLYLNDGDGNFTPETATHMPQVKASIGDLELGDVDGDGDLDMVLADWDRPRRSALSWRAASRSCGRRWTSTRACSRTRPSPRCRTSRSAGRGTSSWWTSTTTTPSTSSSRASPATRTASICSPT